MDRGFNDALLTPGRRRTLCKFRVEKLVSDAWVKMSDWPNYPDEERLQRHVAALGGTVRLMTGESVVREWRGGQEIGP